MGAASEEPGVWTEVRIGEVYLRLTVKVGSDEVTWREHKAAYLLELPHLGPVSLSIFILNSWPRNIHTGTHAENLESTGSLPWDVLSPHRGSPSQRPRPQLPS